MTRNREGQWHPEPEALNRCAEDGLRGEEVVPEVGDHLEACPACRREVEEIRELLRRTGDLPRGIQPSRDLWPGVESRVRPEGGDGSTPLAVPGPPRFREAGPWLAAAAAVLVALTAGTTLWLADGRDGASDPADAGVASAPAAGSSRAGSSGLVEASRVGADYRPMVDRLTAVLESEGDRLPPETREVVEHNLEIIDAAIAEAESALARHPASPELVRVLDRSYQRKIDLLRRSARLTAQM